MTTRIKLRRDTAQNWADSNPILANGETGIESDTNQFKFGDGVTVWNSLGYANANGGAKQSRWVSVLNTCGNGQYTAQSSDGVSWTAPTTVENNQYEYIYGIAIGPNSIVYLGNNPGYNYVKWAKNPSEQPQNIEPISMNFGSADYEDVNFEYVKYVGGYFIAYGSYYASQVITSPIINIPYWIYSEDGQNWHRGGIDAAGLETIIDTRIGQDSDTYGMRITDVNYNDTGWLFSYTWDYYGASPGDAGGFYLTDITGTLNAASRGTNIPTAQGAHWDGVKWWSWIWDNEDDTYYTNTSVNPTTGTWIDHSISTIANTKFGNWDGYSYSIEDISQGTVDGVDYLFMAVDQGRMLVSADKGTTWSGVVPSPYTTWINGIDGGPYAYIQFDGSSTTHTGEKITISGSTVSAMNGSFYVGPVENTNWYPLYSDITIQTPVPIAGWNSGDVITNVIAAWTYGSYKINVLPFGTAATELRVGMICTSNGAKILAINSDTLTMDTPNWTDESNTDLTFRTLVTHSHGNYIYQGEVGGEEVLVLCSGEGSYFAMAHADPRVQNNWKISWGINSSQAIPNFWVNDFKYGILNPVGSSWNYQNPELKEAINEMILTDRFTLSLTGQGQYDPPISTTLFMDPNQASWSLSTRSNYSSNGDLGSISSWEYNDVRMTINSMTLALNHNGTITVPLTSNFASTRTASGGNQTIEGLVFNRGDGHQKVIGTQFGSYDNNTVERLVIMGGDSYYDGGTSSFVGEGGDIYLWAGKGGDGGDIKIDAGVSVNNNTEGGTIKIRAGDSTGTTTTGGYVYIQSGQGTQTNGNIRINAGGGNQWTFEPDGSMTFPSNTFRSNTNLNLQVKGGTPSGVTAISSSTGSWESNPTVDLATTGGSGSGLIVDISESGGYAQTIAISTAGSGYTDGDTITVTSGSSSATFTISVPSHSWIFGNNGNLTLSGGAISSTPVANIYSISLVTVNINALINKLTPANVEGAPHYHVPNGTEGQIMHLVMATSGAVTGQQTTVSFDSARWTGTGYVTEGATNWEPFSISNTIATIIYVDGAWNLPHAN